jgi:hypothetical protein
MRATALPIVLALAALACAPVPRMAEKTQGAAGALALPFVEDDYARALAEAKSKAVPLFVEAWAPW